MSTTPGNRLDKKTVRIRARFDDDTAVPPTSKARFVRTGGPLSDTVEHEILFAKPEETSLDQQGEGSVVLGVTDDPDLNPTGFTWTGTISGPGIDTLTKTFSLPRSLPDVVYFDALGSVPSVTPTTVLATFNDPRIVAMRAGGTSGQALRKASNADYDTEWGTVSGGSGVPDGGTTGQALTKNSSTNGDAGWSTIQQIPTGGTTGQVLAKTSGTNFAVGWTSTTAAAASVSYAGGGDVSAGFVEGALDTLATRLTVVNNGASTATVRPAGITSVIWIGTAQPANATASDIWVGAIGAAGSITFSVPTGNLDIGDTADSGTGTAAARATHQHAFPAPAAGYPVDVAATEADGTATTPARSDHQHKYGAASITDAHVAAGAAIAESKLSLASDAIAATPSRRSLGVNPTQAAQGDLGLALGGIPYRNTAFGRLSLNPGPAGSMITSGGVNENPVYMLGIVQVNHGTTGTTARPTTTGAVYWVGTADPVNMDESKGDFHNDLGG